MPWYYLHEATTGRLVSVTSVAPSVLPDGITSVELSLGPSNTQMWDESSRTFISRPLEVLVDRIQDLANDSVLAAVWTRLTVAQRQVLRDRLALLLGPYRLRNSNDGVNFV